MNDSRVDAESDPASGDPTNRRRFLTALCALGSPGLAGCGADDGDGTDTPTDQETDAGTTTTATPTATPTDEPGCRVPDPPESIVSFDGVRDGAVVVSPTSETVTATFSNPYLGTTLENGSVELDVPDGDWTIEPASGTEFDVLDTNESQEITWNVSVPERSEEFDVTVTETYSCEGSTYELEPKTRTFRIAPETPAPGFVDYDLDVSEGTPASVVRQNGHFTPLQLLPGGGAQMVYFPQESPEGPDPFVSVGFPWAGNYDDGEWHHMVVSYDATDGLSGYIDGELVEEGPDAPGELASANFAFGLAGAVADPVAELYEGALDEVAVYDTAISADQAQSLADGETAAEESLVSKWTFEEIGFDRVQDQVGDNTLFLANGPEQVSGEAGQALQFDGEETYAGASNSESLNLTERKSVSFWFRTEQSL